MLILSTNIVLDIVHALRNMYMTFGSWICSRFRIFCGRYIDRFSSTSFLFLMLVVTEYVLHYTIPDRKIPSNTTTEHEVTQNLEQFNNSKTL
jgi:hypothetical protein